MEARISLKGIALMLAVGWSTAGCVSGSNEPHADGPGATTPTAGPTLCRDGTAPPCNDR